MQLLGALMGFLLLSGAVAQSAPSQPIAAPILPSYPVTLTAYNAVPEQTDSDPFTTASGAYSNPEIIAARSQDLAAELPFGTIVEIDGSGTSSGGTCGFDTVEPIIGYRVIGDVMNARYTNRVDILFSTNANYIMADGSTKNAGTILGVCGGVTIRVVGRIDMKTTRLPKTQKELAAIVEGRSSSPLADR